MASVWISDRDVGMFSNLHSVIGLLDHCDRTGDIPCLSTKMGRGWGWWKDVFVSFPGKIGNGGSADMNALSVAFARRAEGLSRDHTHRIFKTLRVRDDVMERARSLWLKKSPPCGLHVRGAGKYRDLRFGPDAAFAALSAIPDCSVYAASDDVEQMEVLSNMLGGRALCQECRRGDVLSPVHLDFGREAQVEAFVDMLCLSMCKVVFGGKSNLTNFVQAANPDLTYIDLRPSWWAAQGEKGIPEIAEALLKEAEAESAKERALSKVVHAAYLGNVWAMRRVAEAHRTGRHGVRRRSGWEATLWGNAANAEAQALKRAMGDEFPGNTLSRDVLMRHRCRIFVETGSGHGDGIRTALNCGVWEIHSCEADVPRHDECCKRFGPQLMTERVSICHDRSNRFLSRLVPRLSAPATFWLDAHGDQDAPLYHELSVLAAYPDKVHAVLVDDVRMTRDRRRWGANLSLDNVKTLMRSLMPNCEVSYEDSRMGNEDILVAKRRDA